MNTTAELIRLMVKKALDTGKPYRFTELRAYVEEKEGRTFTHGEFAGAMQTICNDPKYQKIGRGIYQLVSSTVNSKEQVKKDVTIILENTVKSLKERLNRIDITEYNEQELKALVKFNLVIRQIEQLKNDI